MFILLFIIIIQTSFYYYIILILLRTKYNNCNALAINAITNDHLPSSMHHYWNIQPSDEQASNSGAPNTKHHTVVFQHLASLYTSSIYIAICCHFIFLKRVCMSCLCVFVNRSTLHAYPTFICPEQSSIKINKICLHEIVDCILYFYNII
jgi:hypothetical protein